MKRRLFTAASALSLLLFFGAVTMWVRGYFRAEGVSYSTGSWTLVAGGSLGKITLSVLSPPDLPGWQWYSSPYVADSITAKNYRWHMAGFGFDMNVKPHVFYAYSVICPLWFVALLTSILPIVWYRTECRRRAARVGLCPACGYDLRASKDACPECGAKIAAAEVKGT